jgi:transposase InsO family protein
MLNIIDEFTKEALTIRVERKLNSTDVVDALTDLFILRGPPEYIRSDNGPEFITEKVRNWIVAVGAKTAFIEPGSPWENGYCESFNARFRDEMLNGARPKSSSSNGGATTTRSARTAPSAIVRRRQKASSQWTRGLSCTNKSVGPLSGGSPLGWWLCRQSGATLAP